MWHFLTTAVICLTVYGVVRVICSYKTNELESLKDLLDEEDEDEE